MAIIVHFHWSSWNAGVFLVCSPGVADLINPIITVMLNLFNTKQYWRLNVCRSAKRLGTILLTANMTRNPRILMNTFELFVVRRFQFIWFIVFLLFSSFLFMVQVEWIVPYNVSASKWINAEFKCLGNVSRINSWESTLTPCIRISGFRCCMYYYDCSLKHVL